MDKQLLALTGGVLVAVFGWMSKQLATWYLRRRAIRHALLFDIRLHAAEWVDHARFMNALIDTGLQPGRPIAHGAHFTPSDFTLYDRLLPELSAYLPLCFARVVRFYGALKAADLLLACLLADIQTWRADGRQLSADDIDHLTRRWWRIGSHVDIFHRRPIRRLSDLPEDYSGLFEATTVFDSRHPPPIGGGDRPREAPASDSRTSACQSPRR
ncbi:hypothetical protein [Salinisphaera sp. T31B1]|uniref:hypothetical protein n=1 Tax=Salinisphaera sp. T31B1 TaxID=727963 RepID=UPI003341C51C